FSAPSFSDAFRRRLCRHFRDRGSTIHLGTFSFTTYFSRVAFEAGSSPRHGPKSNPASKHPGANAAIFRTSGFACGSTKSQAVNAVTHSTTSACQRRTLAGRSSLNPVRWRLKAKIAQKDSASVRLPATADTPKIMLSELTAVQAIK